MICICTLCTLPGTKVGTKKNMRLIGDFLELFGQLGILSANLPREAAFHAMPGHYRLRMRKNRTWNEKATCKCEGKKREEQRIHFLFWIWKIEIWKIEFTKIHLEFLITTRRHWKIIIWKVDMIHLSWGIDFFHTAEMPSFNRLIRLNRKFGKSWHVGQNDGKDETNIILASKLHHFDPLRQRRNL